MGWLQRHATRAVTQRLHLDPHVIKHGQKQVGHRRFCWVGRVAAVSNSSAGAAGDGRADIGPDHTGPDNIGDDW